MTPETIADLRRLLDEVRDGSPLPWRRIGSRVDSAERFKVAECLLDEDAILIAAAVNALPALLDAAAELLVCKTVARGWLERAERRAAERDALAAKVERVRDWLDHRGVDASDRDGAYMDGYRAAQRHAVIDAAELRAALDEEAQP